jgi:acetyl esterase/lipase
MKKVAILSLALLVSCSYKGSFSYVKMANLDYGITEQERQRGDLYLPDDNKKKAGVILVHGGGWKSRDRSDMATIAESLVSHGLVVLNINYRLAPEYRHPSPVEDLELAVKYLRKNAENINLDPERIGLWGYSSGGHTVSFYALTRSHDTDLKVSAVVSGGAPYDFSWYPHSPYIKGYLGKFRDEIPKAYRLASASEHVVPQAPPFFLYHAVNDRLVEYAQTSAFEAKLKEMNIPVQVHAINFWGHGPAFVFSGKAIEKGVDFFKEKL